jgi:hypothetical protein
MEKKTVVHDAAPRCACDSESWRSLPLPLPLPFFALATRGGREIRVPRRGTYPVRALVRRLSPFCFSPFKESLNKRKPTHKSFEI